MTGIFLRWVFAFGLLAATFNPTRWNYVHWARLAYADQLPETVLSGLMLLIGYIIYLRATLRSIGMIGMGLVSAIVAASVWVLIDQGIVVLNNSDRFDWLALIGLSFVLGIGLSWSHVRRAISGQYSIDDDDG